MSVFGSIFGKNKLGKGSHDVAFTAGAHSPRLRPGRSGSFPSITPRARRIPARPVPKHNIGGAHPRALSLRRWKTPSGMSPQSGRSMIEMLAVLAIIGILSVVAVAGLMWAFAKHKANDTIHDVHLWELAALDSNQLFDKTSGQLILHELGSMSTHGYPMAIWIESEDAFSVHVNDVPKRVCSLMLDMVTADQIVTVNDVLFESADICDAETNLMIFYLSKDQGAIDQACIPACSGTERCCGGECRTIQTPCGSDGCTDCGSDYCTTSNTCCPTPTATKCGSEDCCEGNCCNNVCCPSDQVCGSDGACACQNNLVMNPTTGLCECPSDTPYYFEDANLCCQSGYTPVDGVCQKIDCRGGPTNYDCYINDKQCGYNCDSLGRNCVYGFCHADECLSTNGEKFGIAVYENSYGCWKQISSEISCYRYKNNNGGDCFKNNEQCCSFDGTNLYQCSLGTCDVQDCPSETTFFIYRLRGSCQIDNTNIICVPKLLQNTWECYKNDLLCGKECSDLLNCSNCITASGCTDGMTYNEQNNRCENEQNGDYCIGNLFMEQHCYASDNSQKCSYFGDTQPPRSAYGNCTDPGCAELGMIYTKLESVDYWGCQRYNAEEVSDLECYFNSDYQPGVCYYNGSLCGQRCDYNGTNCGMVYLPQCALAGHCPQTGYAMTDGCTCDGDVTTAGGTDYCCPAGHTYTNGRCAIN